MTKYQQNIRTKEDLLQGCKNGSISLSPEGNSLYLKVKRQPIDFSKSTQKGFYKMQWLFFTFFTY